MGINDFGIRLARLRKGKNLTQAQLAELLNISNKTVSRWETGEGYPEISLLPDLADVLDVSSDYLLTGEETQDKNQKDEFRSRFINAGGPYRHKDIGFRWKQPRFRDLTVFNKTVLILILIMLLYYLSWVVMQLMYNAGALDPERSEGFLTVFTTIGLHIFNIGSKAAPIVAVGGLAAGLLDFYDRQSKVSIILLVLSLMVPDMINNFGWQIIDI